MSGDLDVNEARVLASRRLRAMPPPSDDEWVILDTIEHDWGWAVSFSNRRAVEGSRDTRDMYAGAGPFLIDRQTGRVARTGSGHPVEHYIELWRSGEWPDSGQAECECSGQLRNLDGADAAIYAAEHLEKQWVNAARWMSGYECPLGTGRHWVMNHPHGELQGGGSPHLRVVSNAEWIEARDRP